jgi:hypothetical protein
VERRYSFDYVNDQAELDRQIQAKSPGDVEGYRRFLAYSEELLQEGYIKLGTAPFLSFSSMLRAAAGADQAAGLALGPRQGGGLHQGAAPAAGVSFHTCWLEAIRSRRPPSTL